MEIDVVLGGLEKFDIARGYQKFGAETDTGVLFIGATLDPHFRAFETRTGRELWKALLPTSARATPLIFATERQRQMVAIAAGGHDSQLSGMDTKLVVFALRD